MDPGGIEDLDVAVEGFDSFPCESKVDSRVGTSDTLGCTRALPRPLAGIGGASVMGDGMGDCLGLVFGEGFGE